MIGGWWLVGLSWAADPCAEVEPVSVVAERLAEALRATAPDPRQIEGHVEDLASSARCLQEPVDDGVWVRALLDLSVFRFQMGMDWQTPRRSAAWSRPDLRLRVGPALAELRDWDAPGFPAELDALPFGREVWLDGRRRTSLPELDGWHLVQGRWCGDWTSEVLTTEAEARGWRTRWYEPCAPEPWLPRDKRRAGIGGALLVAGTSMALASFLVAAPWNAADAELSRGTRRALRGTNAGGWAAMAAGSGLVVTAAVGRARQVRRDRERP